MAIILEFKDYAEVHEALELVNEGFFSNMWNRLKDAFKGIDDDVAKAIASDDIDKMLDPKTGALTNVPRRAISYIESELKREDATAEDVKKAMEGAFATLEGEVKSGTYYKQVLKFLKDGVMTLQDQSAAVKTAGGAAQSTAAQKGKEEATGTPEAQSMQKGTAEQMKQRYADFKTVFDKAKAMAKKNAEAAAKQITAKAASEKNKLYVNNRFATTETVLLLIEYDILKLRVGPENLADLKNQMVQTYKVALNSAKQLQQAVTGAKGEKMTPEAYDKLKDNIQAFMKEYPAENVTPEAPINDFYVYPYDEADTPDGIVISKYDVNEKTVGIYPVNGKKVGSEGTEKEVDFATFHQKMLEGSKGVPPVKQKGGVTGAPAPQPQASQESAPPKSGKGKTVAK